MYSMPQTIWNTGDEAFKSICRVLGPLTKKPTLGVQHAVEAGYLFKEHASISAWLFTFLSYCEVTKPLSRIKTITRMRRIYKRRLVIAGFIISGSGKYLVSGSLDVKPLRKEGNYFWIVHSLCILQA